MMTGKPTITEITNNEICIHFVVCYPDGYSISCAFHKPASFNPLTGAILEGSGIAQYQRTPA
jgi:hypothetical protein